MGSDRLSAEDDLPVLSLFAIDHAGFSTSLDLLRSVAIIFGLFIQLRSRRFERCDGKEKEGKSSRKGCFHVT